MAALDAVGVVADAVALGIPVVPGGVGVAIRASRAATAGVHALQTANMAVNVGQGINQSMESYERGETGWAVFYAGTAAIGFAGAISHSRSASRMLSPDLKELNEGTKLIETRGIGRLSSNVVSEGRSGGGNLLRPPVDVSDRANDVRGGGRLLSDGGIGERKLLGDGRGARAADEVAGSVQDLTRPSSKEGAITDPSRMLSAGRPTTLTREQVARWRGTNQARGQVHGQHLAEFSGGRTEVSVETPLGRRVHDARAAQDTLTELAFEGKNYLRWRTVGGARVQGRVPLSPEIRRQIHKDVLWIREGRKGGIHRVSQWDFPGAPPSHDLARLLERWGLPYVHELSLS
jgi:hypothetical protein